MRRTARWPARRWVVALAALLGAALTARMGLWQLDRAAQKQAIAQAIAQRAQSPLVSPGELAYSASAAAAQHHRQVALHGHWLGDKTVYLDNRQMNGRPGFYVVTPLRLGPGDAVLVQRGWMPRDLRDRTLLQPLLTPAGEVRVEGRIAPPPARLFEFDAAASGAIRQNLDPQRHALEVGMALRPLSVLQSGVGDGLLRQWPQPQVDIAKHHGYAFQWFALSALITGLYVWFQLIAPRRQTAD